MTKCCCALVAFLRRFTFAVNRVLHRLPAYGLQTNEPLGERMKTHTQVSKCFNNVTYLKMLGQMYLNITVIICASLSLCDPLGTTNL